MKLDIRENRWLTLAGIVLIVLVGLAIFGVYKTAGYDKKLVVAEHGKTDQIKASDLKQETLDRLRLSDLTNQSLIRLGLHNTNDPRLPQTALGRLRDEFLAKLTLNNLKPAALEQLTISDLRDPQKYTSTITEEPRKTAQNLVQKPTVQPQIAEGPAPANNEPPRAFGTPYNRYYPDNDRSANLRNSRIAQVSASNKVWIDALAGRPEKSKPDRPEDRKSIALNSAAGMVPTPFKQTEAATGKNTPTAENAPTSAGPGGRFEEKRAPTAHTTATTQRWQNTDDDDASEERGHARATHVHHRVFGHRHHHWRHHYSGRRIIIRRIYASPLPWPFVIFQD